MSYCDPWPCDLLDMVCNFLLTTRMFQLTCQRITTQQEDEILHFLQGIRDDCFKTTSGGFAHLVNDVLWPEVLATKFYIMKLMLYIHIGYVYDTGGTL